MKYLSHALHSTVDLLVVKYPSHAHALFLSAGENILPVAHRLPTCHRFNLRLVCRPECLNHINPSLHEHILKYVWNHAHPLLMIFWKQRWEPHPTPGSAHLSSSVKQSVVSRAYSDMSFLLLWSVNMEMMKLEWKSNMVTEKMVTFQ